MIKIYPEKNHLLLNEEVHHSLNNIFFVAKRKVREFVMNYKNDQKQIEREDYLIQSFKSFFKTHTPLFFQIQIETCSFCNDICSFCPANIHDDTRGKNFMSPEIFSKIIKDLKALKFNGLVSLFNNNEPLIDKRLESFIAECKREIPDAKTAILTNGKLLTFKRFQSLYDAGLDALVIDNYYQKEAVLNGPIKRFVEDFKKSDFQNKINISIFLRYQHEILSSRAGNAPNKKGQNKNLPIEKFCPYPFMQYNVNYEGMTHLCCNDVYYEGVVGDITKNSIKEIWETKLFDDIRNKLLNRDRNHGVCKGCDATNGLSGDIILENGKIQIPSYKWDNLSNP